MPRVLILFYAPFKILWLALQLLWMLLFGIAPFEVCLLQNPPAVPTLMIARLACTLRAWGGKCCRCCRPRVLRRDLAGGNMPSRTPRLVVDWHNFGFTILAYSLPRAPMIREPVLALAKAYERICGRAADGAFCVTRAMKAELATSWGVEAAALHDRPPSYFRPATLEEQHGLFVRNAEIFEPIWDAIDLAPLPKGTRDRTLFTYVSSTGGTACGLDVCRVSDVVCLNVVQRVVLTNIWPVRACHSP